MSTGARGRYSEQLIKGGGRLRSVCVRALCRPLEAVHVPPVSRPRRDFGLTAQPNHTRARPSLASRKSQSQERPLARAGLRHTQAIRGGPGIRGARGEGIRTTCCPRRSLEGYPVPWIQGNKLVGDLAGGPAGSAGIVLETSKVSNVTETFSQKA